MPADATVECDAIPAAAVVTATDNCDPTLTVDSAREQQRGRGLRDDRPDLDGHRQLRQHSDGSQTMTWSGHTAPALVGVPADATVECDAIPAAAR